MLTTDHLIEKVRPNIDPVWRENQLIAGLRERDNALAETKAELENLQSDAARVSSSNHIGSFLLGVFRSMDPHPKHTEPNIQQQPVAWMIWWREQRGCSPRAARVAWRRRTGRTLPAYAR